MSQFSQLREEFIIYYREFRCEWAPQNPLRIWNLAVKSIYPEFRSRISPSELLAFIFTTLGFTGSDPIGLFDSFNPDLYSGSLSYEDHFVNFFGRKLRGNIRNFIWITNKKNRVENTAKFQPRPELGLLRKESRSTKEQSHLLLLRCFVHFLTEVEQLVIHLLYWEDLSTRKAGARLSFDHKKVQRVRDRTLERLRLLFKKMNFHEF